MYMQMKIWHTFMCTVLHISKQLTRVVLPVALNCCRCFSSLTWRSLQPQHVINKTKNRLTYQPVQISSYMSHKGRLRFPTCRANWSRRLRRSRLAGCRSGSAYGWSSPFFRTFVIGFESVLDAVILVTNRTHHLYKLRVWETVIIVNLHVHTVCM